MIERWVGVVCCLAIVCAWPVSVTACEHGDDQAGSTVDLSICVVGTSREAVAVAKVTISNEYGFKASSFTGRHGRIGFENVPVGEILIEAESTGDGLHDFYRGQKTVSTQCGTDILIELPALEPERAEADGDDTTDEAPLGSQEEAPSDTSDELAPASCEQLPSD